MSSKWKVNILTLFPQLFPGPLAQSVTGRGLTNNIWSITTNNIRDYSLDKHRTVDDVPYGGGSGMVIRPDVLSNAIYHTCDFSLPLIYLSPRGRVFNQDIARGLAKEPGINLICGRFEAIDERIIEKFNIDEISIGDYILSSGDLAAYVVIDTCLRNIEGILNCSESLQEESFGDSQQYRYLLEYPHYTKPRVFEGYNVPSVLLEGNHKKIAEWRLLMAQNKTKTVRKDLWNKYLKSKKEVDL
jgi:tRNA (guanine37-N1)-methyltransferase